MSYRNEKDFTDKVIENNQKSVKESKTAVLKGNFVMDVVSNDSIGKDTIFSSIVQVKCYRELLFMLKSGPEDIFKRFLNEILDELIGLDNVN